METSDGVPFFDVVVVGAGLAGLAAGATAARSGRRVLIVDGHPAGGRARTDERNGFRFNQGAHALYLGGHAERVLRDLGVGRAARRARPRPTSGASPATWCLRCPSRPARRCGRRWSTRSARRSWPGSCSRSGRSIPPPSPTAAPKPGSPVSASGPEPPRSSARSPTWPATPTISTRSAPTPSPRQIKLAISQGVRYLDGGWQVLVDGLQRRRGRRERSCGSAHPVLARRGRGRRHRVVLARRHRDLRRRRRARPRRSGGRGVGAARAARLGAGRPADDRRLPRPRPAPAAAQAGGVRRRRAAVPLDARPGGRPCSARPARSCTSCATAPATPTTDRAELWALARTAGIREDDVIEQRFLARMIVT